MPDHTPPLPVTVIRDLRTTLSEEARNALNFFKLWYPDRARPRSAPVLLVSVSEEVRRTTSPRQVSTFPPGKYNFFNTFLVCVIFLGHLGDVPQGKVILDLEMHFKIRC